MFFYYPFSDQPFPDQTPTIGITEMEGVRAEVQGTREDTQEKMTELEGTRGIIHGRMSVVLEVTDEKMRGGTHEMTSVAPGIMEDTREEKGGTVEKRHITAGMIGTVPGTMEDTHEVVPVVTIHAVPLEPPPRTRHQRLRHQKPRLTRAITPCRTISSSRYGVSQM